MLAAITPLSDFDRWARTGALEIVLYVTGAILITRFAGWISQRVTGRIDRRALGGDALVRSEAAKHRHAVIAVVTWTFLALVYFITGVLVIQRLGVPLTSLVAPATVAGVALGFGAQRIVQDVLAGFFIVAERQYGFGDSVRISPLGVTTGVTGVVEEVTLRVTRLRTMSGEVVFVPNGQIVQVTNLSRDWARAVIDVPIPVTADVSAVTAALREIGENAFSDSQLRPLLLDPPSVMGIESIAVDQLVIRMVARTLPGKQFDVSRVLRQQVAVALRQVGIMVPTVVETSGPETEQKPTA
jgi:small conductance mechanosensitive channel